MIATVLLLVLLAALVRTVIRFFKKKKDALYEFPNGEATLIILARHPFFKRIWKRKILVKIIPVQSVSKNVFTAKHQLDDKGYRFLYKTEFVDLYRNYDKIVVPENSAKLKIISLNCFELDDYGYPILAQLFRFSDRASFISPDYNRECRFDWDKDAYNSHLHHGNPYLAITPGRDIWIIKDLIMSLLKALKI